MHDGLGKDLPEAVVLEARASALGPLRLTGINLSTKINGRTTPLGGSRTTERTATARQE